MAFRLNLKSLERLRALVRAGTFVDTAWSFTPEKSNALLGDPPNWTDFQLWFLGIEQGKPDNGVVATPNDTPHKDWFAFPFGDGTTANLNAIREIVRAATAAGDMDVANAAAEVLGLAAEQIIDKKTASGAACDRDISFGAPAMVKASAGKSLPTFTADAYTGGKMKLDGWDFPMIVDYDGIDFTDNARPVLLAHDKKKPLGHTTNISVSDGILKATGIISASGEHVNEVVQASKNGFPWQVSIGANVVKNQFVPAGATAYANGKTWSGPVNIARKTVLQEISILSLGADDDTSARIAAKAAKGTSMKFKSWAKAAGLNCAEMDDDTKKAAKATFKAAHPNENPDDESEESADAGANDPDIRAESNTAPATRTRRKAAKKNAEAPAETEAGENGGDDESNPATITAEILRDQRGAILADRQRTREMVTLLDEYRTQVLPDKFATIEAKAIGGEYDRNRTELELIKARRPDIEPSRNAPMINTGAGGQADGTIIAAAAARSMGISEKAAYKGLTEQAGNIAASLQGLTLHSIIAMSARRLGMHVAPGSIDDSFLGDFLRRDKNSHQQQIMAHRQSGAIQASSGAGFSTVSLTGITENILYKAMLESFGLQTSVVQDIAYERDTNDFKPFKVYRLTASGDFLPIGPTGELKNFSLQDESYQNQVTTKGALLVLKREDIINDDMGALMQAPQVLGRKGALNREKTVIAAWLSGTTTVAPGASTGKAANAFNFWSTGALNYQSGAASPLSMTSLQKAEQQFLEQKDANNDPINVMPDRLLVSPSNKVVAENMFNGANLTVQALDLPSSSSGTSAAQTGKQVPNLNYFRGKYRPITSPFLSSKFLGNDTQWGLLANPAGGFATVQVGYLRGQRTPIIKQVETDAIMLGIAYQAIYDFGVALLDYRCGQYSAGA